MNSMDCLRKKIILLAALLMLPLFLPAQVLKERRVYYLDCSQSMAPLWDDVRNNLKNAIDNVNDETTELMVIPFAFDKNHHGSLSPITELATQTGKDKLKKRIDGLNMGKSTMTYLLDPLSDFYNQRVSPSRVTYMFLMTDGQDEGNPKSAFTNKLKEWNGRYNGKNVYGFYVMLNKSAKNPEISSIIKGQSQLWEVNTADVNINLVRLQNHAVFNAKNDKYFDLPIYGNASGKSFSASFKSGSPYTVKKVEKKGDHLRVYVSHSGTLPVSINVPMNVKMSGGGKFDFLVTEVVNVKCENKPERTLKITVK